MKTLKNLSVFLLVMICGVAAFAQSAIVGKYEIKATNQNGEEMVIHVTMTDDMKHMVDYGADGNIETQGEHSIDGDQVTIWDLVGAGDCEGKKGVYKFSKEGKTLTMTKISEECPNRGGPEGKMVMTQID